MKRKTLKIILIIEGLLCVLFTFLPGVLSGLGKELFTTVLTFPFEQIGMGLRVLSLSGAVGNVIAIALYLAISLLPVGYLMLRFREKNVFFKEDVLLVLLSAVLFFALYCMINPGIGFFPFRDVLMGKVLLSGTIYSIVYAYVILRVLGLFFAKGAKALQRYMIVLVGLVNMIFVYAIFGDGVKGLLDNIAAMEAGNAGSEHLLGASYVFLFLQYVVDVLPYALNIWIAFLGMDLLEEMGEDPYSETSVLAAQNLSKRCGMALGIVVLSHMAFNLMQLVFAKNLVIINSTVEISLFSIGFLLAALLFSRYIAENKALKDDNDSIV